MEKTLFGDRTDIPVHARLVGERIDIKALEDIHRLAPIPLTIVAGTNGAAVLFRYGVVVLFGLEPMEEASFLGHLAPFVHHPLPQPELEEATIRVRLGQREGVALDAIVIDRISVDRLQLVADILAKSVVLAYYEHEISDTFVHIEPLAVHLQEKGRGWRKSRELLHYIGGALLTQHRTVGRVEIMEKPEILWEHPELERLYQRLSEEYELRERHFALDKKLSLISNTANTLLDLLHTRRSLRVEWYIVILIVVEIILTLYELFFRHQ